MSFCGGPVKPSIGTRCPTSVLGCVRTLESQADSRCGRGLECLLRQFMYLLEMKLNSYKRDLMKVLKFPL